MTNPPEPHPLELLRQEASTTPYAAARAQLTELTAQHLRLAEGHRWKAGAEDVLRTAIGMERKAQMEMRIGLGDDANRLPLRKTKPLADLTLSELLAEYRDNRHMTLQVLDLLHTVNEQRPILAWTMGEEVPPELHILSVKQRLTRLGEQIAEQQL